MKRILNLITMELEAAFTQCGYDAVFAKVTLSNRPDLCEYQCNGAMAATKKYGKKPIDIANEVVKQLESHVVFSKVEAVMPGFVNLSLSEEWLADYVNQMASDPVFGCNPVGESKTMVVDYGGANVAKPLHVGHLRSAIIGESIKRMGQYLGYQMIGDVHLGDWGLQMGLIIEELKERFPDSVYFDESYNGEYEEEALFTLSELEEIYPYASGKSKEDEAFKERAQYATLRLQSGYAPYRKIWQQIMAVSIDDLKRNYEKLNVFFDLWKGESDAQPYIPELIDSLQKQGLSYESNGALVVDIGMEQDHKEYPPCIVRKSDGAALYATSDLATLVEREAMFHPSDCIYVVDKRQELHFTQVFRVAKKAKIVREDTNLHFLGFGTMNGKDGKPFKTREGGVMRLETLIADIECEALKRILENRTMEEEEAREIAKIVGLAALKYGDLSNQASKDYVFDIERFTSFEGNTGPYILYTIVRLQSILNKYEATKREQQSDKILPAKSEPEKTLMLLLSKYNEVLEHAFLELAPHKVCQYMFELSNGVNHFYHEIKILAEEDRQIQGSYIKLITLAKEVLTSCTSLLGIQVPKRM